METIYIFNSKINNNKFSIKIFLSIQSIELIQILILVFKIIINLMTKVIINIILSKEITKIQDN